MGTVKKAVYKVDNGTDFDEIHFKTDSEQVYMSDGNKLQSFIENLPIPNPNLIRNSSAEYGTWGDTSGWYAYTAAGSGGQYFSSIAHNGERSLKLQGMTPDFAGYIHTKSSIGGGYLKTKPGTKYVLSAYVKTVNVAGTGAYLRYKGVTSNQGVTVTDKTSTYVTGTQDWTRLTLEFTASGLPPTVPIIYLGLTGTGEVFFDDIKLEEEKLSPWCVEAYDQLVGKEILESGSNANGRYVKFADGTMLCYASFGGMTTSEKMGVAYMSPNKNWAFPAAFNGVPRLMAVGQNYTAATGGTNSSTSADIRIIGFDSVARVGGINMLAIGQWI